jgi:hypothetical protein
VNDSSKAPNLAVPSAKYISAMPSEQHDMVARKIQQLHFTTSASQRGKANQMLIIKSRRTLAGERLAMWTSTLSSLSRTQEEPQRMDMRLLSHKLATSMKKVWV